jgi:hypothetical protein
MNPRMRIGRSLLLTCSMFIGLTGCGGAGETSVADASLDTVFDSENDSAHDSPVAPEAGTDGAPLDADARLDAPAVPPPGTSCEYGFFSSYFDKDNGATFAALRDATFLHLVSQVSSLQACGSKITLGGMLSLLIFEGGGAKVAFFNDRCAENSYDKSAACWNNPKARYSYQYGLAPVHTSNFHPCADVAYTSKMRARLAKAMGDAGFAPSAAARSLPVVSLGTPKAECAVTM